MTSRRPGSGPVHDMIRDLVTPPAGHVAGLDALRAAAVLMVVMYHSSEHFQGMVGRGNAFARLPFVSGGWRGVDLFFVLSGYLIGRQLWREFRTTGSLRLCRFIVIRRGLRIWPLYYVSLAAWLVGSESGRRGAASLRWWTDAAFVSNYLPGGVIAGAWSLCVEEQFYLLAPLLVLGAAWILGYRRPSSFRPWLLALLVAEPLIRLATLRLHGHQFSSGNDAFGTLLYSAIHTHADSLLIGLLLANLADERRPDRPGRAPWFVGAAVVATALARKFGQLTFDFTSSALVFGSLVWLVLTSPRASTFPFNSRVFSLVSRLSFGMYLNHQLILEWILPVGVRLVRSSGMPLAAGDALLAAILAILSAAAAAVTYGLVEWPALRLRDHLIGHAVDRGAPARSRGTLLPATPLENPEALNI